LLRFINERTGADKENQIKALMEQISLLHNENQRLKKINRKTEPITNDDKFLNRLLKINKQLNEKLKIKGKGHFLDLDVVENISKLTPEQQERLTDMELKDFGIHINKEFRDDWLLYGGVIKNTPITGKQIERYIDIKNSSGRIFNKGIWDKLYECKTSQQIDQVLDEYEKLVQSKNKRESFDYNFNFNFDDLLKQAENLKPKINYREKLGLSSSCTNEEVKKEFKNLLKILHPDCGGNAKLFQQIKQDYDEFRKII
jgi:hypothetical protein